MEIKKTKSPEGPGYVYVPYVFKEHTEESLKEYDDFMKSYEMEHSLCPKCGSDGPFRISLVGYPLIRGKESEYQDKNRSQCERCGDVHIIHDRKPKTE